MAFTAVGFDGTVTESQWAAMMANVGAPSVVVGSGDLKATVVSGVDRTISIAAGVCHAHGVMGTLTPAATVQHATVGSGTRWDAVVARRDWTANTIALVIVQGTATQTYPAGLLNTPGTSHDQVLALVQITAGVQLPTAVLDERIHAGKVWQINSLLSLASAPIGTEAVLAGVRYRRELVAGSVATVRAEDTGWTAAAITGYAGSVGYRRTGGTVHIVFELDSTSAQSATPVTPTFVVLPVEYRPSRWAFGFVMIEGTRMYRARVSVAGLVQIVGMTTAVGESINGSVTFPAA